ncbi:MAG: PhoH family protein [Candidatus Woesearchaeota archaeon]
MNELETTEVKDSSIEKSGSQTAMYDPKNKNNSRSPAGERKHYFLDTSSLMLNPLGIFKLAACRVDDKIVPRKTFSNIASVLDNINADIRSESPNNIYISKMVEWELNDIKDRKRSEDFESARQAMQVIDVLSHIKTYGRSHDESLSSGITLPNGAKIFSVPHNEFLFRVNSVKDYESTRDDRILFDYFQIAKRGIARRIFRMIRKLSGQPVINIPSGEFIQVVTEDTNFQGSVHDMVGKTSANVSCSPLIFERTKHPNPAEQYTGIYSRPLILSPDEYVATLHSKGGSKDRSKAFSINDLTSKAVNKNDFKDLDSIVMNQFLRIMPSEPIDSGDLAPEFFMRRQQDRFVHLKYSTQFIDEEYHNRPSKSSVVKSSDSEFSEYIYDKNKLLHIIRTNPDLHSTQRNKLKKMINVSRRNPEMELVNDKLQEYLKNNKAADFKEKQNMFSRQQVLSMPFNPLVVPDSEQVLFVEYLNDPSIGLVSFVAPQGAGKTYFALASGLRQVRMGLYDEVTYIRPVVVTGEDLGYNPGKTSEKIRPFMLSCEDSLEKIFSMRETPEFYKANPHLKISNHSAFINSLYENGIINYQVLTYMAGRTLSRSFVIMDESHLLNREQMRLFIGRIGETSKCVLLGDYAQLDAANADIVRKYHLTPDKLGLSHLIEKVLVKNNKEYTDIYSHISINRNYTKRSRVAGIGNLI